MTVLTYTIQRTNVQSRFFGAGRFYLNIHTDTLRIPSPSALHCLNLLRLISYYTSSFSIGGGRHKTNGRPAIRFSAGAGFAFAHVEDAAAKTTAASSGLCGGLLRSSGVGGRGLGYRGGVRVDVCLLCWRLLLLCLL